jgi:hypothetical protein
MATKKRPELSGLVQTAEEDPKQRQEMGRIALWLSDSENPRAPRYIGEINASEGGSKFRVSVWENSNQKKKDGGRGGSSFLLSDNCWTSGKLRTDRDLVMNYCNACALKTPSRIRWDIETIEYRTVFLTKVSYSE